MHGQGSEEDDPAPSGPEVFRLEQFPLVGVPVMTIDDDVVEAGSPTTGTHPAILCDAAELRAPLTVVCGGGFSGVHSFTVMAPPQVAKHATGVLSLDPYLDVAGSTVKVTARLAAGGVQLLGIIDCSLGRPSAAYSAPAARVCYDSSDGAITLAVHAARVGAECRAACDAARACTGYFFGPAHVSGQRMIVCSTYSFLPSLTDRGTSEGNRWVKTGAGQTFDTTPMAALGASIPNLLGRLSSMDGLWARPVYAWSRDGEVVDLSEQLGCAGVEISDSVQVDGKRNIGQVPQDDCTGLPVIHVPERWRLANPAVLRRAGWTVRQTRMLDHLGSDLFNPAGGSFSPQTASICFATRVELRDDELRWPAPRPQRRT